MEVQLVDEPLFDALAHDRPTAGYHDVAFPRRGGDSRLVDCATQVVDEGDLETQLPRYWSVKAFGGPSLWDGSRRALFVVT